MKRHSKRIHYIRWFLLGLAAVVSLAILFPAPYTLAQGPTDERDEATKEPLELPPVTEADTLHRTTESRPKTLHAADEAKDPHAGAPEVILPQGVPEGESLVVPEPFLPGTEPGDHEPGARPVSHDGWSFSLDPQIRAWLERLVDQLLERLGGWMHKEADQVSDSFNQWLHQEVDRLIESLEQWLAEVLSETVGSP